MPNDTQQITDEQVRLCKEYAANPVKFSELFENTGLSGERLNWIVRLGCLKFTKAHHKNAVESYLHHDKLIHLWCDRSEKWVFESVIMLWEAIFRFDKIVMYVEHMPVTAPAQIRIASDRQINKYSKVTDMEWLVCSLYQSLPEWLRGLCPAQYDTDIIKFKNGSRIIFVDSSKSNYRGYNPNVLVLHGVNKMPDDEFRSFISTHFQSFFINNPAKFHAVLSSEGGERGTLFEGLCKVATDITKNPDVQAGANGWVLDVVRHDDLPPDELALALGGKSYEQERPWAYSAEFL